MTSPSRDAVPAGTASQDVVALIPMVRRIIGARVGTHPAAEDLVQETLARVMTAAPRIDPGMLAPYAMATAKNVVASMWRDADRQRRHQHRVVDLRRPEAPDERVMADEERAAVAQALAHLSERERELLLAHEVAGQDTRSLAALSGSTPGAVAAQLARARARLRVEYLLEVEQEEPPSDRCRPVLFALSSGDRRRQREVDAAHHMLACELCGRLSQPLVERGQHREDEVHVPIRSDADIVAARQAARELATKLSFSGTELTLLATAVSEVARNIVRFAGSGELTVALVTADRPGVQVVARDAGPGIPDVDLALTDGYSTYHGLGLGLPGARRLMDEFAVISQPGTGTTVTMTKWCQNGGS